MRTAALQQADEFLLYWPHMIAGYRAGQRRDYAAAIDAFERATGLAPDNLTLWHWLATASLAAGRQDTYQRACDELVLRCGPNTSRGELSGTLGT